MSKLRCYPPTGGQVLAKVWEDEDELMRERERERDAG